jgi:hypothetical protein
MGIHAQSFAYALVAMLLVAAAIKLIVLDLARWVSSATSWR